MFAAGLLCRAMDTGSERSAGSEGVFEAQPEVLELLDLLVDVMFCMKDTESRYRAVNPAFVKRAGRKSKRDVIGRRAAAFFPAPLAQRYEEQDRQVFATGRPLRNELELIRREDGGLGWYVTTKLPVANQRCSEQVSGLVSISRDLRTPSSREVEPRALQRTVEYVRENLIETIRVADLATAAGLSQSQLYDALNRLSDDEFDTLGTEVIAVYIGPRSDRVGPGNGDERTIRVDII